jgi:cold shock CspA family protein
MADTFNKKQREKKKQKKKREKREKREAKKLSNNKPPEFMYVGVDGNLTPHAPDPSLKQEVSLESIDISTPSSEKSTESKFEKSGSVKFINLDKGYGFIISESGNESFFVHVDELQGPIRDGDQVVFEAGQGPKGPVALNVRLQS